MTLRLLGGKPLGSRDSDAVRSALALDPVAMCMVAARVEEHGVAPRSLGGELWSNGDPSTALCFSGANMIPLLGDADDIAAFAARAVRSPRQCSSVVGRAEHVLPLWEQIAPHWGPAREVRPDQPLLALSGRPDVSPDRLVRPVRITELDRYLPAAVAMFTAEVGIDPCAGDAGRSYRRRIAALISSGRAFARFEDDQVVFKAEIGSLSRGVGQIQGVWVDPARRGEGLGATGTAAVVEAIAAQGRVSSLYVNSYNVAARDAYRRVGFRDVGTFATILVD